VPSEGSAEAGDAAMTSSLVGKVAGPLLGKPLSATLFEQASLELRTGFRNSGCGGRRRACRLRRRLRGGRTPRAARRLCRRDDASPPRRRPRAALARAGAGPVAGTTPGRPLSAGCAARSRASPSGSDRWLGGRSSHPLDRWVGQGRSSDSLEGRVSRAEPLRLRGMAAGRSTTARAARRGRTWGGSPARRRPCGTRRATSRWRRGLAGRGRRARGRRPTGWC
jgi:hypothetical protein